MGNSPSYAKLATIQWYREGGRLYGRAGYKTHVIEPAAAAENADRDLTDEEFAKKWKIPASVVRALPAFLAGQDSVVGAKPTLAGRLAVVTGANQGIGFSAAMGMAQLGAEVVLVCRNAEKGAAAQEKINDDATVQKSGGKATVAIADLSDLASIRDFVSKSIPTLTDEGKRPVDILVNNAGVMTKKREWTAKGNHDTCIATALGGTVLLTTLLLPAMQQTQNGDSFDPRVINVSSGGQYTVAPRATEDLDLREGWDDKSYDGTLAYGYAKRYQTELTLAMAQTATTPSGLRAVSFFSMHPGWTATAGVATAMPDFEAKHRDTLRTLEQGSDTIVYLASAPREALAADATFAKANDVIQPFWEPEASSKQLPGSGHFFFDRRIVRRDMPCGGTIWTETQRASLLHEARRYVEL